MSHRASKVAPSVLFVALAALSCTAGAQDLGTRQVGVTSHIIVKFRAGSPGAEATAGAIAGRADAEASLTAFVDRLGERVALPLSARRVTSGHEVLIALDVPALSRSFLSRLRERETIESAIAVPDPPTEPTQPPTKAVASVVFTDPEMNGAYIDASRAGQESSPRLERLVEHLAADLELPLSYRVAGEHGLEIQVDLAQATAELTTRLEALEDVEYAEQDQVMRHMDRSGR